MNVNLNYQSGVAITPSDSAGNVFAAIYVGGAGNVTVEPAAGGNLVTFTAPPVGTIIPIATKRVMSTDTTATLLVGLS